jgi:hypothetical protein
MAYSEQFHNFINTEIEYSNYNFLSEMSTLQE